MIIWGTRGKDVHVGGGQFYCPRCSSDQQYEHKQVKQYFTLYFIPLIPMGTAGEYVQCSSCAGTFATEILTYDPEKEKQETAISLRRMCVLMLLDMNRCNAAELKALQDTVSDMVDQDIEASDIATDVRNAQSATTDILTYVKRESKDFSDDGKWAILVTFRKILESQMALTPQESDRLVDIGKAMGLRGKHVQEFVQTPLEPT